MKLTEVPNVMNVMSKGQQRDKMMDESEPGFFYGYVYLIMENNCMEPGVEEETLCSEGVLPVCLQTPSKQARPNPQECFSLVIYSPSQLPESLESMPQVCLTSSNASNHVAVPPAGMSGFWPWWSTLRLARSGPSNPGLKSGGSFCRLLREHWRPPQEGILHYTGVHHFSAKGGKKTRLVEVATAEMEGCYVATPVAEVPRWRAFPVPLCLQPC